VDRNSTIAFNFEQLDVYHLAVDLVNDIYILTKRFPREEIFGLTSQLRRAGVSIASNIAEGSARTNKEFAHFVNISRGSVLECVTLLEVAYKQNYLAEKEFMEAKAKLVRLSKMLSGLRRAVNHKPTAKTPNPKLRTTNYEPRTTNHEPQAGFTLIELVVAVGILAMVISFAGVIFRVSIDSQRTAAANAEILQKLRVITEQLNADFKGLRKDGEIFVLWVPNPASAADPNYDGDGYVRFDRIMFFANGDFQSYGANPKVVRGQVARISYMLAKNGDVLPAQLQPPVKRILARTQHILTDDPNLPDLLTSRPITPDNLKEWHNSCEYDKTSLQGWKNIPWSSPEPGKAEILSSITEIRVLEDVEDTYLIGAVADPTDPNSIHIFLAQGVGEFKIQAWYEPQHRWIPEIDINGDGRFNGTTDTDFKVLADGTGIDLVNVPGVLYTSLKRAVVINNIDYDAQLLDEAHFDAIPGLGRAFKFTFTLYDSKGIIKNGRTFTHIVFLGG
jgi:four helix bundle protein